MSDAYCPADLTEQERNALLKAGNAGGEYLDEIKKSDIGELSLEQFDTFIWRIVSAFHEGMTNGAD